jgi:hypothetical protein
VLIRFVENLMRFAVAILAEALPLWAAPIEVCRQSCVRRVQIREKELIVSATTQMDAGD